MSRAEQFQSSSDREQKLAKIVGDILAINTIETELRAFTEMGRPNKPFGSSFAASHMLVIRDQRRRINGELSQIGGLPSMYVNSATKRVESTHFVAWNGPVGDNSGLHLWRPVHQPNTDITVSEKFFDDLYTRYVAPTGPKQIDSAWRNPEAYL